MPSNSPKWTVTPDASLQINSVALSPDGQLAVCGTSSEFGTGAFGLFAYDAEGQLRWQSPLTPPDSQQGVFWVAVSDDKRFAAAGGETGTGTGVTGFLALCRGEDGALLQNLSLPTRVNQVSFNGDGRRLLAALSSSVSLYSTEKGGLEGLGTYAVPEGMVCNSALLSTDGRIAWLSGIDYTTGLGCVQRLSATDAGLELVHDYPLSVGAMRVAISADGHWCAAAMHDGSCVLLEAFEEAPRWHYAPTFASLSVAYAIAVTRTSEGRIVVACGANAAGKDPNGGYLYLLESHHSEVPPQEPTLSWYQPLPYAPNPGVCLDAEARFATATDGKPDEQNGGSNAQESPGHFYLFAVEDGRNLWSLETPLMNWPMVITPSGRHILGGSDTGTLYCWEQ